MIPVSPLCQTTAVSPRNSTLRYSPGLSFAGVGGMKLPSPELPQLCSEPQPGDDAAEVPFNAELQPTSCP